MGNPFEWLRSIARSRSDEDHVAIEAASALATLAHDPAQLVVACRRVLEHHRSNGALWWVASQLLASPDPAAAARLCHDQLANDRTASRLRDALPLCDDGARVATIGWNSAVATALDERFDIDVVAIVDPEDRVAFRQAAQRGGLIEPWQLLDVGVSLLLLAPYAAAPLHILTSIDARDALIEAPDVPVWAVTAVGRLVAPRLFDAITAASRGDDTKCVLSFDRVTAVVGPHAVDTPADLGGRLNCLVAPELLRPL